LVNEGGCLSAAVGGGAAALGRGAIVVVLVGVAGAVGAAGETGVSNGAGAASAGRTNSG